ncbi:Adenylate-forming enzyme [Microbacterium esteraromaticum]|uniref:Adenylate-forming enzyme n=1 Tax=Microbacterium esteraromaticum TaxID=57043 RepID=A0A1R4IU89_9MICO|nr:F390 synthetase-related protein [Microbacterium esteraromaticum]SJN23441.1 Adenylate-forming enzyme [Microbacterium esteraromaticum]
MSRVRVVREFIAVRWLRRLRTRAAVQRRQQRMLRAHLRFLVVHSPYFRQLTGGAVPKLGELPLMDKAVMMSNFDALNTVGITRDHAEELAMAGERSRDFADELDGCSVGLSSGTSGHRGLFVVSRAEREAWAGTVLARTLPRGKILGHRIALFLRADNTLYESVASRAVTFEYFDIFDEFAGNLARLEAFQPTILVAPPSVLLQIAASAPVGTQSLQKAYAVAEVLEEMDSARIRSALKLDVLHQIYQCTEGFLAHTCELGTIHLNEDAVLFEREELGDHRFVPIVTDLRRRAQPIVRYRLGDILRERSTPCPCGSALTAIERIEGREGDTLLLAGADGASKPVFADVLSRALLYADGFLDYRIVQTGAARLEIALDSDDPEVRARVAAELAAALTGLGCRVPDMAFTMYRPDGQNKMRRVRRDWRGNLDEGL